MLESLHSASKCHLLAVPVEIRQLVFSELFHSHETIHISARLPSTPPEEDETTTSWPSDREYFGIIRYPLHSQLLSTCKQILAEGLPFLYSQRTFDLTARESLKLLLHNIGSKTFGSIRHIVIEWESLQDFAWSLSKPDYATALAGLHIIEMATWRNRHVDTTGTRWRNVKGYERTMCQAAADILHSHADLRVLAEEQFVRKGSIVRIPTTEHVSDNGEKLQQVSVDTGPRRVKWRFLASSTDLKTLETVVDIGKDLEKLQATRDEAMDGGFSLPIDPF